MKSNNKKSCSSPECTGKSQAACFTCSKIFCFKCSMNHAKQNSSNTHNILQIDDSLNQMSKACKRLIKESQYLLDKSTQQTEQIKKQSNIKLSPQKFQQQLDQLNFMKKQTLKVVQKFFSEISLELVNIWEYYLKKFSNLDDMSDKIVDIKKKMELFAQPWNINDSKQHILTEYFKQNFNEQLQFFSQKITGQKANVKNENSPHKKTTYSLIPKCPEIRIDDRVLVELSQVLCSSIYTKNYIYQIEQNSKHNSNNSKNSSEALQKKLDITQDSYLHKSVDWLPIFPIKKNHCFLYNIAKKNYQIQQFQQLQHIPDYPKTIIIPNGDIHIIGGTKNDVVIDTHLVFRCSSSEVFKLSNMPISRNPSNSLVYWNKNIYLIGGINQKHQWDERCFKYVLESKEWKQIPSMNSAKPHQSCAVFAPNQQNPAIYCFGIPENKRINIEKFSINSNSWQQISISNFLSNPFNFAAGFVSIQINPQQILLFGGKRFLQSSTNNKRSTDRSLQQNVYVFQPESSSFLQKGGLYPCLGVQYGQFYPIISNKKIYSCEYILCKTNPISRWYDNLQVIEIDEQGEIQSVIVLEED